MTTPDQVGLRYRAYAQYNAALRDGRLLRAAACEDCSAATSPDGRALEGHHDDYARPLDVIWLCQPCHQARHRALRAARPQSRQHRNQGEARDYVVTVRGPLPPDLAERVAALHAAAILTVRDQGRPS